ncbi:hypothetical protein HYW44_03235 [Candidatus Daviesbacteria bacterium]|nr:hypothetical protein [Candidatus Daviesbacteria bacterium]
MPFDSKQRSEQAKKRIRDHSGHFISLKPKMKVSGQADLISNLVHAEKETDDSSLINVKVNNPFEKIIRYLKDIRDKQSTTVALKFTIPLIALPIAILMAFQFGRYQSQCNSYFSSQIGTVENIQMARKTAPDNWFLKLLGYLPGLGDVYLKKELLTQPVLIISPETNTLIDNQTSLSLDKFTKSKVLLSGDYNSCTQTLTLDSPENITKF